jgi:hypothetical protein
MKEFIVTEAAKIEAEEGKKIYPPRQRDITLGAGLMLVGVIKAFLLITVGRQVSLSPPSIHRWPLARRCPLRPSSPPEE